MPRKPQPPCLTVQRRASDWRLPRTERFARLTARVSSSRRLLSAPDAVPAPLRWRPTCDERSPALRLAVQSPSCEGAASIANTGVSSLCDGTGGSTDAEIIRTDQAGARSRRHRFYLAIPQASAVGHVVPTRSFRRCQPGTPKLQATELRQDKSRNVRPGRRAKERANISALPRCAVLSRDVRIRRSAAESETTSTSRCPVLP
jgi:hypothetical protein